MASTQADRRFVHRTARIRLRVTRSQADRCYGLMRSAGDVWAWLLDRNRHCLNQQGPLVVTYIALCRELTQVGGFGELSVVGARSVVHRYSDAWFEAAKRRRNGQHAGFPRRKRALVPVRFYNGTFLLKGQSTTAGSQGPPGAMGSTDPPDSLPGRGCAGDHADSRRRSPVGDDHCRRAGGAT